MPVKYVDPVTGDFVPNGSETRGGTNLVISSFSKSNIVLPAVDDEDSNEKTFKAELRLPEGTSANYPGSRIQIRAEYWHDGVLAAFGPPAATYIAHRPPPADGNARDVLIAKYDKLLERQRKYFKAVKEFQEECFKNERLVTLLEELQRGE